MERFFCTILCLAELTKNSSRQEEYRSELERWAGEIDQRMSEFETWNRTDFWKVVTGEGARISLPTRTFVEQWWDLVLLEKRRGGAIADDKTARNLIAVRERQLKGPLARVDNPRARELWGGAAGTDRLAYRWPNAQRISRDILVGFGDFPVLEPQTRKLLFDVLRPPEDHTLDYAIATTYTLDLLALLTAPIAFTLFEADDPKKLLNTNSLTLLESLRRYADRMAIFHHGGYIAVPPAQFPQFEYLERIVVQCKPPSRCARFFIQRSGCSVSPDLEQTITYRFACLSRNLTFDRCWDTVLTLEGQLIDRQNAIARNHPLGDFVAALPSFATNVSPTIMARIDQMQEEVRRVDFEAPDEIEDFAFHPLGLSTQRRRVPFEGIGGRMVVISPFVTDDGLKRLVRNRRDCILISRSESLQQLTGELAEVGQMFSLNEQAETPEAAEDDIPLSRGLHAKCYVIDDGWKASIWTGSANATEQAFNGNIEFLVELVGPKSKFGVDALLRKEAGKTGFADLLVPFSKAADLAIDAIDEELAKTVDGVRRTLCGPRFACGGHYNHGLRSFQSHAGADCTPWADFGCGYCIMLADHAG